MNDYYSEKEDREFTLRIAEYNTLPEKEKSLYRDEIEKRIRIMFYEIPIRFLFATEDQAIDVFLEANDEIDTIISHFRICGQTFNAYLIQICRFKMLSVLRKERRRELDEELFYEAEAHQYQASSDGLSFLERKELHNGISHPETQDMNLKELIDFISRHKDGLSTDKSPLGIFLSKSTGRRNFLILLLYIPETETKEQINSFSEALDLDYRIISQFFILKNAELDDHYETREKALEIAGRHWITIQKLRRAYYQETDEDKLSEICSRLRKISKCHMRKCQIANSALSGMTQQQIADILGISRPAVTRSIKLAKDQLLSVADEIMPR